MIREVPFRTVSRWHSGHYNPSRHVVVTFIRSGGAELVTGFGEGDTVSVYRDGSMFYVLSVRRSLGYVGLSSFDASKTEDQTYEGKTIKVVPEEREIFLQSDHEIADILGKRGLDLRERTILNRLLPYIDA